MRRAWSGLEGSSFGRSVDDVACDVDGDADLLLSSVSSGEMILAGLLPLQSLF